MRSIYSIAHTHCFFRPLQDAQGEALTRALAARRATWEECSPWLKERAGRAAKGGGSGEGSSGTLGAPWSSGTL